MFLWMDPAMMSPSHPPASESYDLIWLTLGDKNARRLVFSPTPRRPSFPPSSLGERDQIQISG